MRAALRGLPRIADRWQSAALVGVGLWLLRSHFLRWARRVGGQIITAAFPDLALFAMTRRGPGR